MREINKWEKEVLGSFFGFQAINFGRTLVVLFHILTLVLRCQGYGRRKSKIYRFKEKEDMFH